jgi:hypothetical protein
MLIGVTPKVEDIEVITRTYEASGGLELFISAEDLKSDVLVGYARLRLPSSKAHRSEIRVAMRSTLLRITVNEAELLLVSKIMNKDRISIVSKNMNWALLPIASREIRKKYRSTRPKVCIARYKIVTDFYKENPQLQGILKRAKNFKNLCEKLPVLINEDEVIVGWGHDILKLNLNLNLSFKYLHQRSHQSLS